MLLTLFPLVVLIWSLRQEIVSSLARLRRKGRRSLVLWWAFVVLAVGLVLSEWEQAGWDDHYARKRRIEAAL